MKAIICTKSGSPEVLQLQDVDKPTPTESEVLVKVFAGSVTQGDVMLRKLHPLLFIPMRIFGVKRKHIPGHEFAGEIIEIGANVNQYKVGDRVFGTTTGLSVGANAEYVCIPEKANSNVMALKPANMTYEEAAVVPVGGMTAWSLLKKGDIRIGKKVLIYGASGSVGTYAVQLAKNFGAEVTAVCGTRNVELVRSLGADQVINYTKEDFTKTSQTYDVIFDAVGKISASECETALKDEGVFLTVQTSTRESSENLIALKELLELGKIKPVIDKCFLLDQVADAHRYVETGHKSGNVVISVI